MEGIRAKSVPRRYLLAILDAVADLDLEKSCEAAAQVHFLLEECVKANGARAAGVEEPSASIQPDAAANLTKLVEQLARLPDEQRRQVLRQSRALRRRRRNTQHGSAHCNSHFTIPAH
jgi:hypothetical protein